MKSDLLTYSGYCGTVGYCKDKNILIGEILYINEPITYQAFTLPLLFEAFMDAVEDYVVRCEMNKKRPQQTFKGIFQIRINPEVHRQCTLFARKNGMSLNEYISTVLAEHLKTQPELFPFQQ
ncbi:MAG: type II toxin-antitoxin system HicB family antitoxin [Candidatus Melainabacteria bacterium]|nr:type II toxin-antitoxin system HicB family antitoxin [Candidatus Melainabacteria bacterium]